jgi:hypothetical protein
VVPPAGTNAPLPHWRGRGEETFVSGRDFTRYKCESFVLGISPGTNAPHRLYHMACTGSIPGTNESYKLVQMSIFPVVTTPTLSSQTPPAPKTLLQEKCGVLMQLHVFPRTPQGYLPKPTFSRSCGNTTHQYHSLHRKQFIFLSLLPLSRVAPLTPPSRSSLPSTLGPLSATSPPTDLHRGSTRGCQRHLHCWWPAQATAPTGRPAPLVFQTGGLHPCTTPHALAGVPHAYGSGRVAGEP